MNVKPTELAVQCPACQCPVLWNRESPFRPFCSKRCQLIDLGEWANEEPEYRIQGAGDSEAEEY